jgi:hypothetical protein
MIGFARAATPGLDQQLASIDITSHARPCCNSSLAQGRRSESAKTGPALCRVLAYKTGTIETIADGLRPDFLKILIEKAEETGRSVRSAKKALLSGAAFPPSLQQWVEARGIAAFPAYTTTAPGAALQAHTRLKGSIELVAPGSLPKDGKVISDERPV